MSVSRHPGNHAPLSNGPTKQLLNYLATTERTLAGATDTDNSAQRDKALKELQAVQIALGHHTAGVSVTRRIECTISSLLRHRAADSSICPSEVARVIGTPDNWRSTMPLVREVAVQLATAARIAISRGDQVLSPDHLGKGPIRLRRGELF